MFMCKIYFAGFMYRKNTFTFFIGTDDRLICRVFKIEDGSK
ncbi:hypothetical protein Hanom_Chr12g01120641 [Helianthus anomalus]